jgi:flavin reductase (DIM6/NTAB) family NADH-FMN oxidoreductase RutF
MKIEITPIPLIHPTTIVVVGTIVNGKPNYTTIGDVAVAGINPPLLMISLHEHHNAMVHINEHHTCTINVPTKELVNQVDYAGMYSSKKVDKSELFDAEIVDGLPVIKDSPITLFLEEHNRIQIKHRVIIVCSITKTMVNPSIIKDNHLNLSNLQSILYGLDNNYYTTGDTLGKGYELGKNI